jgi:hypothetical protein
MFSSSSSSSSALATVVAPPPSAVAKIDAKVANKQRPKDRRTRVDNCLVIAWQSAHSVGRLVLGSSTHVTVMGHRDDSIGEKGALYFFPEELVFLMTRHVAEVLRDGDIGCPMSVQDMVACVNQPTNTLNLPDAVNRAYLSLRKLGYIVMRATSYPQFSAFASEEERKDGAYLKTEEKKLGSVFKSRKGMQVVRDADELEKEEAVLERLRGEVRIEPQAVFNKKIVSRALALLGGFDTLLVWSPTRTSGFSRNNPPAPDTVVFVALLENQKTNELLDAMALVGPRLFKHYTCIAVADHFKVQYQEVAGVNIQDMTSLHTNTNVSAN